MKAIVKLITLYLFWIVLKCSLVAEEAQTKKPLFRFGAVADCQYCNKTSIVRKYSLSIQKLRACVDHYNKLDLAFVVHLGDFIDRDFESFAKVTPIYNRLKAPHYHVLGNHDFSVTDDKKALVPAQLGLKERYYDFTHKGWRFLALDGNDVSLHAYPKNAPRTKAAATFHRGLKAGTPNWNGAVGKGQLEWIKNKLEIATKNHEKVILFCHFPIYPANVHNLWNADTLTQLLSKYSCVVAYINGHNHEGNYGIKNQIHYLTLKGMVNTTENAYSIIEIHKDQLLLKGVGRQEDRKMPLPANKLPDK